jgi:hypothetical protein
MLEAIKLAKKVCMEQGWKYVVGEFWEDYFAECAKDPWMRGETPNPNNPRWKQNLEVLLAEDRMAGVLDRAIARERGYARETTASPPAPHPGTPDWLIGVQ